jgi:hypothetical protein
MKVSELVARLLQLDQEKEINFVAGIEEGRSYSSGHSGYLDMDFDEDEDGLIIFSLGFDEENCDSQ